MKKKFFSIVELLVVIAIIAVLSGILMSALGGAFSKKDKANTVKVIKDLEIAFQKYYNANGEYPDCSGNGVLTSSEYALIKEYCSISDDYIKYDTGNINPRPIDAWGGNIYYVPNQDYGKTGMDITPAKNDADIYLNTDTIQIKSDGNPENNTGAITNY